MPTDRYEPDYVHRSGRSRHHQGIAEAMVSKARQEQVERISQKAGQHDQPSRQRGVSIKRGLEAGGTIRPFHTLMESADDKPLLKKRVH